MLQKPDLVPENCKIYIKILQKPALIPKYCKNCFLVFGHFCDIEINEGSPPLSNSEDTSTSPPPTLSRDGLKPNMLVQITGLNWLDIKLTLRQ